MIKFYIKTILLVFISMCLFNPQLQAQSGDVLTEKYKNNVVELNSKFNNGKANNGFGFIVGEENNKLYIVTADHVVRSTEPGIYTNHIDIQFFANRGKYYAGELLALTYAGVDLALIEINKPSDSFSWNPLELDEKVKRAEKVWFIGRSREWYVPLNPGLVSRIPIEGKFHIEINTVLRGTSGAPLISEQGLVGMIINDSVQKVIALDIVTIKNIVQQVWNKPWGSEIQNNQQNTNISSNIQDEYYWEKIGFEKSSEGNHDEAIFAYNKAIEINPTYWQAWHHKGTTYINLKKYRDAIIAFDKVLEINPNNSGAWLNKGAALEYTGKYQEALLAYQKGIEISPNFTVSYLRKGIVLEKLGRNEEAIIAYDRVIESEPQDKWGVEDRNSAIEYKNKLLKNK